jgi:lipid-binding SYLF domain-containing protein
MLRFFIALVFSVLLFPPAYAGNEYSKSIKVFRDSEVVQPYFKDSYGYAIFPTIGKGGIGIGGAHGKGKVYKGGKPSGDTSMTQVTIGWQLGGQAYSQIIFFQDKRAYNEFTSGNFEFGAQASAVAITAGAQAQAGTGGATASASPGGSAGAQAKTDYHKGMAIFTRAKGGLMYEAAIGGQKFSFTPLGKK